MDKALILNESSLKRLPQLFVLLIISLLGLPYLGMHLGMDFSVFNTDTDISSLGGSVLETHIRGYFLQTLFLWSGFSLAAITTILAFTQYKLINDKVALVIGLSVLFSGSIAGLHTLFIDGLSLSYDEKMNLDAMIWVFSNSINGLILFLGLIVITWRKNKGNISNLALSILTGFTILCAMGIVYYTVIIMELPNMWFKESVLSRPYELVSIIIYLLMLIGVFPKAYRAYPKMLTDCIFYIAITEIVISVYLMLLSNQPYDSAFNVAYFLKLITYLIPCSCFLYNYVASYSGVLHTQKRLRLKQNELKYIASHDPLTNLFNRREFEELLEKAVANSHRYHQTIAMLLIDLDNFKSINDNLGHNQGDVLLQQFAHRLLSVIRKGDILARVGGDEFILILPNINAPTDARQTAEKILLEVHNPYNIDGKLISVSVSIGIAICPMDALDANELLRKTDLAMYKAKTSGKNSYQFYKAQLSSQQHRESELEAHLRIALKQDEFELYFQPIYQLATRQVVGAEILLRWHNAVLGNVSPDEFIPVLERTGLIIDLGNWIVHKTCEQITTWGQQFSNELYYCVNISPIQLSNAQFVKNLQACLSKWQCPASILKFEITEGVLLVESDDMKDNLQTIADLGIQLALDDFGTQYSSLNRLHLLPISSLKIDRSFVDLIKNVQEKVVIVDIIIKLAQELNMQLIAEGIETPEQLEYLLAKECFFGQGFLLSKPLSASEFAQNVFI